MGSTSSPAPVFFAVAELIDAEGGRLAFDADDNVRVVFSREAAEARVLDVFAELYGGAR